MTRRSVRPSWSAQVTVAAVLPCISTASSSTGPDAARPDTNVPGVRTPRSLILSELAAIKRATIMQDDEARAECSRVGGRGRRSCRRPLLQAWTSGVPTVMSRGSYLS